MSAIAADHVNNPRNCGPLENFTHTGLAGTPGEGAFVQIWLIEDTQTPPNITRAAYRTHGCMWSVACASVLAQLVTGRTTDQARLVEPRDIDLILGGLPEGKGEYAEMSVEALRRALGEK